MTVVAITMGILVVALVVWLLLHSTQAERKSDVLESQMTELRHELQTIATAQAQSSGQISAIGQTVSQRLESVTKALQDGVANSATIATHGQTAIATELKNAREQMGQIQKQLGEFHELSRNVSSATKSLEDILGGAKSRGILGEVTLERLLEDCLPPSQFSSQHRFSSGETADAVIFLRDNKLMSIDSKFPLDAFRRISTDGDDARKQFATAVKGHVDAIATKIYRARGRHAGYGADVCSLGKRLLRTADAGRQQRPTTGQLLPQQKSNRRFAQHALRPPVRHRHGPARHAD